MIYLIYSVDKFLFTEIGGNENLNFNLIDQSDTERIKFIQTHSVFKQF